MTTATSIKKGSSHARFLKAAEQQGWDIEVGESHGSPRLTATCEPEDQRIHKVEASFDPETGAYLTGRAWLTRTYDGETSERSAGRDHKIGDLVGYLEHGPRQRAEKASAKQAKEQAEAERRERAKAALSLAADTEEVQRMKQRLADDLRQTERDLERHLSTLQANIAEAQDNIEKGRQTDRFGGSLFNSQSLVSAQEAAAKRNTLLNEAAAIEHLFGPLPKSIW